MYGHLNCTFINLVPKSLHASSIKQYRPISCCSVIYNLVAKSLANRIHKMVGEIVDPSLSRFIPNSL